MFPKLPHKICQFTPCKSFHKEKHVLKESAVSSFFQRGERFLKESVTSKVISGIAPLLRKVIPAFSDIAVFASFML